MRTYALYDLGIFNFIQHAQIIQETSLALIRCRLHHDAPAVYNQPLTDLVSESRR
ncbi:MAG: hypothetical protein RSF78_10180 [Bacteroidales bacterium]